MSKNLIRVQKMQFKNLGNVDAIVVTGMDQNVMGIQTTSTKVPIIDASGMVPEEVEKSINRMS